MVLSSNDLQSQNTPSNISSGSFNPSEIEEQQAYVPDSTIIQYYTLDSDKEPFIDTLFDDLEKYVINRRFREGTLNLGNQGSASRNIFYEPRSDIYTDMGFHQYDIYRKSVSDFPIYESNRTFNDLYFSPSNGSENFIVGAKFSRSFANNLEFSIDYNRINQNGAYANQGTKATQLGIAFAKNSESEKHKWIFSFAANNFNEVNNGGVTFNLDGETPVDLRSALWNTGQARRFRTSVPVSSGSSPGNTRHQSFGYRLDNYINLDSQKYQAHHFIEIENGFYLFSDEDVSNSNDSLVHGPFITDSRGIRSINKFFKLTNQFDIGINTPIFYLKAGIKYQFLNYNNSIDSEQFNDIGLFSKLGLNIKDLTSLDAEVTLGVGENAGNFKIHPRLQFNAIKGVSIEAYLKILRYDPTLIQNQAVITSNTVYNNEFSKINEFVIGGSLDWKKANLELEVNSGVIDNPVFFDTTALPVQSSSTTFLQLIGTHKFRWKFIGMENSVLVQEFSDNIHHLPSVYSIHKLYFESDLFKKRLKAQYGILFYNYAFDGYLKYAPAIGQFYQTEDTEPNYFYTEAFANFKVDRFRVFVKMDNLTDLIIKEPHFQIIDYPQFDATFRFGVRWQLYD
jgi:hypothetical protein